jgi:hypothetical protein
VVQAGAMMWCRKEGRTRQPIMQCRTRQPIMRCRRVATHTGGNAPLFDGGKAGGHRHADSRGSPARPPSSHSSYDDATSVARR